MINHERKMFWITCVKLVTKLQVIDDAGQIGDYVYSKSSNSNFIDIRTEICN